MKFPALALLFFLTSLHPVAAQLTIGFSAEEGYTDGPLHRQPSEGITWREQRPGSYVVDAGEGVLRFDSASQPWSVATLSQPLGFAKVYIIVVDFQVTIGNPSLGGPDSVMNRFNLVGSDGPMVASFRQKGQNANSFDFWLHAAVGEAPYRSVQSPSFSGGEIGLRTNRAGTRYEKSVSDKLRLIVIHRHDDEGFTFSSTASLRNLDTDKEIQRAVLTGWTATEAWFEQADKTFAISTGNMNARTGGDGATSMTIDSLRIGIQMQ